MGRVDVERPQTEFVQRPSLALRRCWDRPECRPYQSDRPAREKARVVDEIVEEEVEEENPELVPQGRLYWSTEAVSCVNRRWAHRSSYHAAAAAADEAAAAAADEAAAAAAAAPSFEFVEMWERADGSLDLVDDREEEEKAE